jgi:2-methylisocitrate lyase-like PEP mutase family enzyme
MRASDEKFRAFRDLRQRFSVLPEAWDVVSAAVIDSCGFPAIGTTSVGLGLALGCPSDTAISKDEMLQVVTAICAIARAPVCIDLESGYADTAAGVGAVVREVIEAGAIGFNIEDSDGIPGKDLRPADEHAERIGAARRVADEEKALLYIVGRTDSFWLLNDDRPDEAKAQESIERANLYLSAGADAIFISGRTGLSEAVLRALIAGIDGPVNTLASAKGLSVADFERLGVRTLHLGSLSMRAQTGYLKRCIERLREGDLALQTEFAIPTKDINELVRPYWQSR